MQQQTCILRACSLRRISKGYKVQMATLMEWVERDNDSILRWLCRLRILNLETTWIKRDQNGCWRLRAILNKIDSILLNINIVTFSLIMRGAVIYSTWLILQSFLLLLMQLWLEILCQVISHKWMVEHHRLITLEQIMKRQLVQQQNGKKEQV